MNIEKMKTNKGITIISLVITIFVIILIAAVSIKAINDNKVVGNTKKIAKAYSKEQEKLMVETAVQDAAMDGQGIVYKTNLTNEMNYQFGEGNWTHDKISFEEEEMFRVLITSTNNKYTIKNDGSLVEGKVILKEQEEDTIFSFTIDSSTKKATVTGLKEEYKGKITKLNIPDYYIYNGEEYKVIKVGVRAFYQDEKIEQVTFPEEIEEIGGESFMECTSLKKVIIPDTIKVLNYRMFCNCSSLNEIYLSKKLTSIQDGALGGTAITNVTIPEGVTGLGANSFNSCKKLVNIHLPESLNNISISSFYDCHSLKNINLPKNLTTLGQQVFFNCYSLDNIIIPEKLKTIQRLTFANCRSLENVTLSNSLETLEGGAFFRCNLKNISIPSSLNTIATDAFSNCLNLTSINVAKEENSIEGSPWGATNATVTWQP